MDVTVLFTALEGRVQQMLDALARMKAENVRLSDELEHTRTRLADLEATCDRWEQERSALGSRIERLLAELDTFSTLEHEAAGRP